MEPSRVMSRPWSDGPQAQPRVLHARLGGMLTWRLQLFAYGPGQVSMAPSAGSRYSQVEARKCRPAFHGKIGLLQFQVSR